MSTAALGFAFQKLNYSFIKISYYFKKFLSNELKFCTSYKNKSITWVGALNASLFRSSLKKEKVIRQFILKNYITFTQNS